MPCRLAGPVWGPGCVGPAPALPGAPINSVHRWPGCNLGGPHATQLGRSGKEGHRGRCQIQAVRRGPALLSAQAGMRVAAASGLECTAAAGPGSTLLGGQASQAPWEAAAGSRAWPWGPARCALDKTAIAGTGRTLLGRQACQAPGKQQLGAGRGCGGHHEAQVLGRCAALINVHQNLWQPELRGPGRDASCAPKPA